MTITKRNVSDGDLDNAAQYSLKSFSFRDLKSKTMHMTRSSNSSRMMIILSLTVLFSLQAVRGKQMFGASLPTRSPAQWSVESRGSQQEEEEEEEKEEQHCLILSGNFSVIFVHDNENPELMNEDMKRLHWRWKKVSKGLAIVRS